AGRPSALRLRERLDSLSGRGEGGSVVVVGDGLTGIETATEIAESRPGLSVALVARGELGARLSAGARDHLRRACDRLGVTVLERTEVEAVEAARVLCADGTALASDATVWTAGFAVGPIAAAGGLEVTEDGRIIVDRTMRSVSYPNVYAVGDSVHAVGDNGRPLPMSCASAGYTGMQAAAAIVGRLTGRKVPNTKLEYPGNHISLGRRDGILQMVDDEGLAKPKYVGGRKAARIKAGILKMSLWANSHPTFGLPKRKHRLAAAAPVPAAPDVSAEKAVA
ncbi:FAD-dependent oxidoreductase, partial [Streptomyces vietnamensis]